VILSDMVRMFTRECKLTSQIRCKSRVESEGGRGGRGGLRVSDRTWRAYTSTCVDF